MRRPLLFSSVAALGELPRSLRQRLTFILAFLQLVALALIIVAIARPQRQTDTEHHEQEGIAIQMLIDVSSSMDFTVDYHGQQRTRMDIAKQVLQEFVIGNGDDLTGRPNDLVGIISFARYADTVCPLTLGHDALTQIASGITINDRPNEDGTAYGDATALAAARMKMLEETLTDGQGADDFQIKSKIIVLLTDGENNCGRHLPLQAAAMAEEWGIRVYTISLGEKPKTTSANAPGPVNQTEELLSRMAEMTGGIFRQAHDFDSLRSVYTEIDQLEKSEVRARQYQDYEEGFPPFCAAALMFLLVGTGLDLTVFGRNP
jgi:Ca-activated chloride channel family protein